MKLWLALLLAAWSSAGQVRLDDYDPKIHTAIIKSGHIIFQHGKITARAPEEPVIAERVPSALLDTPAPFPPGATIRQVLSNTADGRPGEEVLENREFFEALHTTGTLPNAVEFAMHQHGTLGWLQQDYAGERVLWAHSPSVLIVRVPAQSLTLIVSGDAHLDDGNVARSMDALRFFKRVAGMHGTERDESIDQAFLALSGNRQVATTLARHSLNKFPELESIPDVSLLYLFAHLGLPETEASATAVVKAHPWLPTAWFYYGEYLENNKRYREAAACFEKITMHEPPWHNWTVEAARKELTYLKTY